MLLRTVYSGAWRIVAPVEDDGSCELLEELERLRSNSSTEATAAKFSAIWSRVPAQGPHCLPDEIYHRVDDRNEIYEFVGKRYRALCFLADGRIVICSHLFIKKSQKTPAREKRRAIAVRERYLAAKKLGHVVIEEWNKK